jgi:hypothetical protein
MGPELNEIYSCLEFSAFIPAYASGQAAITALTAPSPEQPQEARGEDDESKPAAPAQPEAEDIERVPTDETVLIDDILGVGGPDNEDDLDAGPAPGGPSAPELQRWPGERVFDDEAEEKVERDATLEDLQSASERPQQTKDHEPVGPAEEPTTEPPEADAVEKPHIVPDPPEREDRFVDIGERNKGVDVESATSDKNIDRDQPLREMGWDDYGERLKKRNQPRNKKKE